jgi:hypothetical protein
MRRLILSLFPVILIAIVAAGSIGGCNSGNSCNFDFNDLTNGSSAETQDSEWSCKNGDVVVFTIAFFGDGTGTRSDAGDFTWEQTKCESLNFETVSLESGTLNKIQGFLNIVAQVPIGSLSFEQSSDDLGDITVSCDYEALN